MRMSHFHCRKLIGNILNRVKRSPITQLSQFSRGTNVGVPHHQRRSTRGSEAVRKPHSRAALQEISSSEVLQLVLEDRKERVLLIGGVSLLASTASITLYLPTLFGKLIDDCLVGTGDPFHAAQYLSAIFCVQFLFTSGQSACFSLAGERISARLRKQIYNILLDQKLSYFDGLRTGDLVNRMSSDVHIFKTSVTSNLGEGLYGLIYVFGATAILYNMSPQLTLLTVSIYPFTILTSLYLGKKLKHLQTRLQSSLGTTMNIAFGRLSSLSTIKQFKSEKREKDVYNKAINQSYNLGSRLGITNAILEGTSELGGNLSLVAVLAFGGYQVSNGNITAGDLMSFVLYAMNLSWYFNNITSYGAEYLRGIGAANRIAQIIREKDGVNVEKKSGNIPENFVGRIAFKGITFSYPLRPKNVILNNFSLEILPGQSIALVGESGCGKSTISRILTRLYDHSEGVVELDGVDLRTLDIDWLRKNIGIVSQEPQLFPLSIGENIRYGNPGATDEEVEAVSKLACCHEFIESLPDGYNTVVGDLGSNLSGGQKQRIAIARMMLKNPSMLILDEATSALDAESEQIVLTSLKRLMQGRTTIVIAHKLEAILLADSIAVLKKGKVVEQGSYSELLESKNSFVFKSLRSKMK